MILTVFLCDVAFISILLQYISSITLDFKYLIYSKCQHVCLYVFCWYLSILVFSNLFEFVWLTYFVCCLENSSYYLFNVFICPLTVSFSWIFLSFWESKYTFVRLLRFILQSMSPLILCFSFV